ncbi:MAG: hypothetical protein LBS65_08995 [Desulfovibrio sp.]|jgi:hypothetical protein|nr:hypothetical protein [Desulfovibrio sp.]
MNWRYEVSQSLIDKMDQLRLNRETRVLVLNKVKSLSRMESPLSQGGQTPFGWGYRVASNAILIARIDDGQKICLFTTMMIY